MTTGDQHGAAIYELTDVGTTDGVHVETFATGEAAGSPWGPDLQHGGPVAALLGRALDRHHARPGTRLARLAVDLLGAVPMAPVRVSTRVLRPGRRIELVEATVEADTPRGPRTVARATAWRLATQDTHDVVHLADPAATLPGDDAPDLMDQVLPAAWRTQGFVSALRWRLERPPHAERPTLAWARLVVPLVAGEPTSDLESALAVADTTNGIGARLDPRHFTFLNSEMTVHLHHPPSGPWVGVEARTSVGPDGIATAAAVLHGEDGPVGRVAQAVLVERR